MNMKTTRVQVTLVATSVVEIDVEHNEGDDPADLTLEDRARARDMATDVPVWDIDAVEEVGE